MTEAMQVETEVPHHYEAEALADTEVTHQVDIKAYVMSVRRLLLRLIKRLLLCLRRSRL